MAVDGVIKMIDVIVVQNHENGEQKRKHKKKRINKKWLKRYGVYKYQKLEPGQMILLDQKLYVSKNTYQKLKERNNGFTR